MDAHCDRCELLTQESHCAIRDLAIDAPDRSFCANHSTLTRKPDRIAVGPVLLRTEKGNSILHESPDSRAVRDHLLNIVERVQVRSFCELTLREATAIWQLQAFREPRAHVYIDRIEGDVSGPGFPLEPLEVSFSKQMFRKVVGKGIDEGAAETPLLERITLRGRILLLSSLVAGALTFYGSFVFLYENADPGTRIPVWILVAVSILAGGAFLACGVYLLRRMGMAFLINEQQASAGEERSG